jgi:hypothetical protein
MATKDTTSVGTIFDVHKMKAPNGSPIDFVVNTLVETDDWSRLTPVIGSNAGLTHHGLRTTGLPTAYVVDIGGSWGSSKSAREPFEEGLVCIRSSYEAPKDVFQQEDPAVGEALLREERANFIEAINQAAMNMILRGSNSSTKGQGKLIGLLERAQFLSVDNNYVFDVGGSAILRHALLVKPGISNVCGLYNSNHPTLGIEENDKGEVRKGYGDDSTIPAGEHRYDICIEYMITRGLCIRNMQACKLIANIPVAASDNPGSDIVDAAIDASLINAPKNSQQQWILYLDERGYAKLVKAQNDKTFVYMSDKNIWRTELPMISPQIVIARMDALNLAAASSETEIT